MPDQTSEAALAVLLRQAADALMRLKRERDEAQRKATHPCGCTGCEGEQGHAGFHQFTMRSLPAGGIAPWEEKAQATIANLAADLAEARSERQREHDLRVRFQGDAERFEHHWVTTVALYEKAQERIKTLDIYGDSASELLGREAGKVIALRVEVARLAAGLRYIYVRNYTGAASVAQDVLGGKDLPDDEYRVAVQRDS